jgi:sulfur carrier protein
MTLQVNGQPREMPDGASLQELLDALDTAVEGTAVARNSEIITRGRFADTLLEEGDDIQIVHIVAGG